MGENEGYPKLTRTSDIIYVASYLPRNCGIATFTHDLSHSITRELGGENSPVLALTNIPEGYNYPPEVTFEVRRNLIRDYARAAEYLNNSPARLVSLQHEFGLFGGEAGKYLSVMLANLKKPLVTTLHSILSAPEKHYRESVEDVLGYSHKVVTMSRTGVKMLQEIYGVPLSKIEFIPHGVHDVPFVDPSFYKDKFDVEGRTVVLTFGLLSPNKGIETVLDALPAVVEKYPDLVYVVLGATHPEVKKASGEAYRLSLERKVRDLHIEDNVVFHNLFVELQLLTEYICSCDIYVTPYLSRDQITSGTLAYAVGMGKAVISTPYIHAEELLADDTGVLVDFGDAEGFSSALLGLLEDPLRRDQMRKRAYELGRSMTWNRVAQGYLEVFRKVLSQREDVDIDVVWKKRKASRGTLPIIRLDHIVALSDNVGLFQHAACGIPDRDKGYSSDDVGRGLAALLHYYHQEQREDVRPLIRLYLSFLHHCQTRSGTFHNFMSFDRRFIDEEGSEDTLGRVLWGLGTAVRWAPTEGMRALAQNMMENAVPRMLELEHVRSKAYTIVGLCSLLKRFEGASQFKRTVIQLAEEIVQMYRANSREDWKWFEDILTYGNSKVSEALLLAFQCSDVAEFREVGLESLDFLTEVQWNGTYFEIIGNEGWYPRGGDRAIFGQQPVDAGYLTEAYIAAYNVTDDERYLDHAQHAFEWFLGRNRLNASLYDFSDGSVADGFDSHGISANKGAESVVCYLLAVLAMMGLRSRGSQSA